MELFNTVSNIFQNLSFTIVAAQVLCLISLVLLRRLYLSPISDIPGPRWAAVTRLWHMRELWRGKQNLTILGLHEKHGEQSQVVDMIPAAG